MGVLLCLVSAASFGSLAVFGKLAFDEGASVPVLLLTRFVLAFVLLLGLGLASGRLSRAALGGPVVRVGFLLGAVGYTAQAGLFFLALERIDASVLSLVLYTYPAMVVASALLLGRERRDGRRLAALIAASSGVALVLAGAGAGTVDVVGLLLGFGAAASYTGYILVADGLTSGADPVALSAWVFLGGACSFLVFCLASGGIGGFAEVSVAGFGWMALIAVVATVVPVLTFFAGMRRVGPSAASILSTLEPPVTVALAFAVFGETLTVVQLAGAALVLLAIVLLGTAARPRRPPRRLIAEPAPA